MYQNSRTSFAYSSSPSPSSRNNNSQGPSIRQGLTVEELKLMTAMRMATNNIPPQPSPSLSSNPASSYQTATPQQLEAAGITPIMNSVGSSNSSHHHLSGQVQGSSSRNHSNLNGINRGGYNSITPLQVQRQNSINKLNNNNLPASHHHQSLHMQQPQPSYNSVNYYNNSLSNGGNNMNHVGANQFSMSSSNNHNHKHTLARPTVIPPIQRTSAGSQSSSLPPPSLTPITHNSNFHSNSISSNNNNSYILNHSQYKLFSSSSSQHSLDSNSSSHHSSHHSTTSSNHNQNINNSLLKNFSSSGSNIDSFTSSHGHDGFSNNNHSLSHSVSHPHSLSTNNDSYNSFSNHFNSYSVLQLPSSSSGTTTTSSTNTLSNSNLNELQLYSERDPSYSEKQPHSLLNFNSFLTGSNSKDSPSNFPSNLPQTFLKNNSTSLPLSLPTSSPLPPTNTSSRYDQDQCSNETDYFTSDYFPPSFYSSSYLPNSNSNSNSNYIQNDIVSPTNYTTSSNSSHSPSNSRNPMVKSKTVPNKLSLNEEFSSSLLKSHSLFPKKLNSISPLKERERSQLENISPSKLSNPISHNHSALSLNNNTLNNALASQVAESVLDTPPSYSTLNSKRITPLMSVNETFTPSHSNITNLHLPSHSANLSSPLGPPGLMRGATVSNFNTSSNYPLKSSHHLSSIPNVSLNNNNNSFFNKPIDLNDERLYWSDTIDQDDKDEEKSVKSLESLHNHSADELDDEDAIIDREINYISSHHLDQSLALHY